MIFSDAARDWLAHATGYAVHTLTLTQVTGSTSSSLFLVQGERPSQRFVLRVLDNPAWLAEEPDLAAHEAAALEEARLAGVSAPRLVAHASTNGGFGAPVVLMSFIEGAIELRPSTVQQWLGALAQQLASIHRHPAESFPWHFHSWVQREALAPPPWTTVPHLWEQAIEVVRGGEPASPLVFIHRDYHPANVLWHEGAVSGVVDWINGCRGPAGVDVAHCRSNLVQMYGLESAEHFLEAYQEAADGFVYDPYWELDSILDMCFPEPTFYEPWETFGLQRITPELLRQRVDGYLEAVMRRMER